jgi:hypothetical protein
VGCTCSGGPAYCVVVRESEHAHREVVGRDRQQAELALLRLEDSVEEGDYRPTAQDSICSQDGSANARPGQGGSGLRSIPVQVPGEATLADWTR